MSAVQPNEKFFVDIKEATFGGPTGSRLTSKAEVVSQASCFGRVFSSCGCFKAGYSLDKAVDAFKANVLTFVNEADLKEEEKARRITVVTESAANLNTISAILDGDVDAVDIKALLAPKVEEKVEVVKEVKVEEPSDSSTTTRKRKADALTLAEGKHFVENFKSPKPVTAE
ncbi:MAG: hypothetical protein LLF94_11130 [Chlamydiales bacterium]|nr:hypothetical protein [Chlamydiales bacterium]